MDRQTSEEDEPNPKAKPSSSFPGQDPHDDLILEFRERLSVGERLTAKQVVEDRKITDVDWIIDLAFAEYLERERAGECIPLDAFCRQFPEQAEAIREQILFHRELTPITQVPEHGASTIKDRDLSIESLESPSIQIPGLRFLRRLGHGGMGVVWLAFHERLQRKVAVKLLRGGEIASPLQRARFETEAQAAAAIRHRNVVLLDEFGEQQGQLYLVMEYVSGGSLQQFLESETPDHHEIAQFVATIARVLHVAHRNGIVHRDLKPANILLEPIDPTDRIEGTEDRFDRKKGDSWSSKRLLQWVPKVADFGLAKLFAGDFVDEGPGLTQTGDLLGTPYYMAPEQLSNRNVGPWTDIYALGAILYQMLTKRPLFHSDSPWETLRRIENDEPERLPPTVPLDLRSICAKCLEKHPLERYASMELLAQDLDNFLNGKAVSARPVPFWQRGYRVCKRYPIVTSLALTSSLAVLALLGVSLWSRGRLQSLLEQTETSRSNESMSRLEAQESLYRSSLNAVKAELHSGQPGRRTRAMEYLEQARQVLNRLSDKDAKLAEWNDHRSAVLALVDVAQVESWQGPQEDPALMVFDRRLDRSVRFNGWEVVVRGGFGKELIYRFETSGVTDLRLSPNGMRLLLWGIDVRVFGIEGTESVDTIPTQGSSHSWSFSDDSRYLSGIDDQGLILWDTETKSVARLPEAIAPITSPLLSPDAKRLALVGNERIQVLDRVTGEEFFSIPTPPGVLAGGTLCWHPDSIQMLVATDESGKAVAWNTISGERVRQYHVPSPPLSIHYDLSGRYLFANSIWSGRVEVIDVESQEVLLRLAGHVKESIGSDLEGNLLFCDRDVAGQPALWTLRKESGTSLLETIAGPEIQRHGSAMSPDGKWLAISHPFGLELFSTKSHRCLVDLPVGENAFGWMHFDRNQNLWYGLEGGLLQMDLRSPGEIEPKWVATEKDFHVLAVDATGSKKLVTNGVFIKLQDIAQTSDGVVLGEWVDARSAVFSHDGRWVAVAAWNRGAGIRVWNVQTHEPLATLPVGFQSTLAVSPDSRWLFASSSGGSLWDTGTWKRRHDFQSPESAALGFGFAFTNDSRSCAYSNGNGQIRLLELDSMRASKVLHLPGQSHARNIALSRDSQRLYALGGSDFSSIRWWDLKQGSGEEKTSLDSKSVEETPNEEKEEQWTFRGDVIPWLSQRRHEQELAKAGASKDWGKALQSIQRGLRLDPNHPRLRSELAWLLLLGPAGVRNDRMALKIVQSLDGDDPDTILALGLAFVRNGQANKALSLLRWKTRDETSFQTSCRYLILSLCHASLEESDLAKDYLKKGMTIGAESSATPFERVAWDRLRDATEASLGRTISSKSSTKVGSSANND